MKANLPGDLSRESMPDAPDADYIDTLFSTLNEIKRSLQGALARGITIGDNTPYVFKDIDLPHGSREEVSNPLAGLRVKRILVGSCLGLNLATDGSWIGTTYALAYPAIAWEETSTGKIAITATYASGSPTGRVGLLFYGE